MRGLHLGCVNVPVASVERFEHRTFLLVLVLERAISYGRKLASIV